MPNGRDTRDPIEIVLERQIKILRWLADGGEALEDEELINHAVDLRAALSIYQENLSRQPTHAGYTTLLERLMTLAHDTSVERERRWDDLTQGPPAASLGAPCPTCGGSGRT